jgi:hypothetical protein
MTIIAEGMCYRILSDGTWFYPQYWSNELHALCWKPYTIDGSIVCFKTIEEVFAYLTPKGSN